MPDEVRESLREIAQWKQTHPEELSSEISPTDAPLSSEFQIPVQKEVFDLIQLYKEEFILKTSSQEASPINSKDEITEIEPSDQATLIAPSTDSIMLGNPIDKSNQYDTSTLPTQVEINNITFSENEPHTEVKHTLGQETSAPLSPRKEITVPTEPTIIEAPEVDVLSESENSPFPGLVLSGNHVVITHPPKKCKMQQNLLGTSKTPEEITCQGKLVSISKDYFLWSRKGTMSLLTRNDFVKANFHGQKAVVDVKLFKTDASVEHHLFAASSRDGRLVVWSVKEGQEPKPVPEYAIQIPGENRYVSNFLWHPTKKNILLCVTNDNEIFHLSLNQLKEKICTLEPNTKGYTVVSPANPQVLVTGFAYSKCSKFIGCSLTSGKVNIWESITFQLLQTLLVDDASSFFFHGTVENPVIIVGSGANSKLQVYKKNGIDFELDQTVSFNYSSHVIQDAHLAGNFLFLHDSIGTRFGVAHIGSGYTFDYYVEFQNELSTKSLSTLLEDKTIFLFGLNEMHTWTCQLNLEEIYSQQHVESVVKTLPQVEKVVPVVQEPSKPVEEVKKFEPIEISPMQPTNEIRPISSSGEIATELNRIEYGLLARFEKMLDSHTEKTFSRLMTEFEKKRREMDRLEEIRREKMLEDFSSTFQDEIKSTIVSGLEKATKDHIIPMMNVSLNVIIQKEVKSIKEQIIKAQQAQMGEFSKKFESQLSNLVSKMEKPIKESILVSIRTVLPQTIEDLNNSLESKMEELSQTIQQINSDSFKVLERKLGEIGIHKGDVMVPSRIQDEVIQLLRMEKWDDAFRKVLMERDLALLSWFIKQMNPESLENITLSHAIMLAMMQQISCDLENDKEVKLQWLYQGSLYLDTNDPVVRQQVKVLMDISENLKNSTDSTETYRMVVKSIAALIKKINK